MPGNHPIPAVMIWSHKGGVGKSTVAAILTQTLHTLGARVGFFDADLTGPSGPSLFGIDSRLPVVEQRIQPVDADGIPVISTGFLADSEHSFPWHGPLLKGALHQLLHDTDWSDTRLLIVDTPPGTAEIQKALLEELNITAAVLVTSSHELATTDTIRSLSILEQSNIRILAIVENMSLISCPNCHHAWQPFPGPSLSS